MKRAVAFTTLLVAVLAAVNLINPVRDGLSASYFANTTWSGQAAVITRDAQPSQDRLIDAWGGTPPAQFSTAWTGSFLVMRDGPYALATISDDGSSVFVDGERVVDNGGHRQWPRGATGIVNLTRGVHALYVQYMQDGGPFHFELLWARAGEPLERMPVWALTPRRVGFWSFVLSAALKRGLAAAQWIWVGTVVVWVLMAIGARVARGKRWLEREQVWPTMRWILAGSLLLNAAGIWWGLPGGSWMPDELAPAQVLTAAALRFAHGWFDRYPPMHFYVLTVAYSPILFLDWLGRLEAGNGVPLAILALLGRLVSVAAADGTLLAVYVCGAMTFGRRAGVCAAAMLAVVTPFVYYAKSANLDVPYVFWFALSLVFYLRALDAMKMRDVVGFAACGALAICTKDQAYGLYVLPPLALIHRLWQLNREAGTPQPLVRALVDVRLRWAAVATIGLFALAHNVIFNARGFWDHVLFITGPASATYRDFEPTLAGRLALLRLSVDLVRVAWGWPMFLVAAAGVVVALMTPVHRRATAWLLLPVVSYYLTFVNVVLYNYDRFMLPVCVVLSLFGGLAFDRWLAPVSGRRWRAAVTAGAFACTALYAATVDAVMLRDSRYTVEHWLTENVRAGEMVGYVFPLQYYPRLERFNSAQLVTLAELGEARPAYFVLNADYAAAEPRDSDIGQLIAGLQNGHRGYTLVFRFRQSPPWPWLPGSPRDLVGDRKERPITSVMRHINPWYEVFKKLP